MKIDSFINDLLGYMYPEIGLPTGLVVGCVITLLLVIAIYAGTIAFAWKQDCWWYVMVGISLSLIVVAPFIYALAKFGTRRRDARLERLGKDPEAAVVVERIRTDLQWIERNYGGKHK